VAPAGTQPIGQEPNVVNPSDLPIGRLFISKTCQISHVSKWAIAAVRTLMAVGQP